MAGWRGGGAARRRRHEATILHFLHLKFEKCAQDSEEASGRSGREALVYKKLVARLLPSTGVPDEAIASWTKKSMSPGGEIMATR